MSDETRDGLKTFAVFNLALAAIFFFTVAFFVVWLEYDYITTSSILFTVLLAVLVLILLEELVEVIVQRNLGGAIGLLLFILLAMGAVTVGLSLFTAIKHPEISDRFDVVSRFWGLIASPFVLVGNLVSRIGPAMKQLVGWIGHTASDVAGFINPKAFVRDTMQETMTSVLVKSVVFTILLSTSLLLPKRFRQSLFARLAATA